MKILISARLFYPEVGGIQTYSYELAKNLVHLGHEVRVLCPHTPEDKAFDVRQPFKIVRIPGAGLRWIKIVFYLVTHFLLLWRYRPHLTIATMWAPSGIVAFLAKRFFQAPYLMMFYGSEIGLWKGRWPIGALMKKVASHSLLVVAISRFTAQKTQELGIEQDHIHVIPCGVSLDRFGLTVPPLFRQSSKKVLLSLAALVPRKGFDMVIRSLPIVKATFPNFVYRIAGSGADETRLKHLVAEYHVEEWVEFTGFVPESEVPNHMASCDVMIMPSRQIEGDFEGFGIVFLEANACGKPVIAGNSGGIPDAVIHQKTGLLVDPENTEAIAEAILTLFTQEELAQKLGTQGYAHSQQFSWLSMTQQIEHLIQNSDLEHSD